MKTVLILERGTSGYWAAILEAIRGSQQDFTEGSLRRAIVLLAWSSKWSWNRSLGSSMFFGLRTSARMPSSGAATLSLKTGLVA